VQFLTFKSSKPVPEADNKKAEHMDAAKALEDKYSQSVPLSFLDDKHRKRCEVEEEEEASATAEGSPYKFATLTFVIVGKHEIPTSVASPGSGSGGPQA
jgi:hypothetical protein